MPQMTIPVPGRLRSTGEFLGDGDQIFLDSSGLTGLLSALASDTELTVMDFLDAVDALSFESGVTEAQVNALIATALAPYSTTAQVNAAIAASITQALAQVEGWARVGSLATIPLAKIPASVARVTGIAAWARTGNTDPIPADKLVNAPGGGGGGPLPPKLQALDAALTQDGETLTFNDDVIINDVNVDGPDVAQVGATATMNSPTPLSNISLTTPASTALEVRSQGVIRLPRVLVDFTGPQGDNTVALNVDLDVLGEAADGTRSILLTAGLAPTTTARDGNINHRWHLIFPDIPVDQAYLDAIVSKDEGVVFRVNITGLNPQQTQATLTLDSQLDAPGALQPAILRLIQGALGGLGALLGPVMQAFASKLTLTGNVVSANDDFHIAPARKLRHHQPFRCRLDHPQRHSAAERQCGERPAA